MQVVHTAGEPPNHGKMNFPISGWTWKSKNALMNTVTAYENASPRRGEVWAFMRAADLGYGD